MKKRDIPFSNRKDTRSFSPRRTSWNAAVRNSQKTPKQKLPAPADAQRLPASRRAVSALRGAGTAQPQSAAERPAASRRAAASSARVEQPLPRAMPGPPRFRHSRPRAAERFHASEAEREPAPPVPSHPVPSAAGAPQPPQSPLGPGCHAHPPRLRGERGWARPYLAEHLQVVLIVVERQHLGGGGEQRRLGRTGGTREGLEPSPAGGGQRRLRRPALRFHPSHECGRRPHRSRSPGRRNWPPAAPPTPARPRAAPGRAQCAGVEEAVAGGPDSRDGAGCGGTGAERVPRAGGDEASL